MPTEFPKSHEYIQTFIKWLAPDATFRLVGRRYDIELGEETVSVQFGEDQLDDFEIALNRFQGTNYFQTLENQIRFQIFIALGSRGLIPYVQISSHLLSEKGEWLRHTKRDVAFDADFAKVLHGGLTVLSDSLKATLATGLNLPEIQAEKDVIDTLKRFYQEKGHLTSPGAELESLSYLKAAAVVMIMKKEQSKAPGQVPRVRKAIDAEIYSIVARLRDDPFKDIKLPEAICDFVAQQSGNQGSTGRPITPQKIPVYVRDNPQTEQQDRLDALLEKLDTTLKRRRKGAWAALKSDNADRLSQAANSMVELLDQVISRVCGTRPLAEYLKDKYKTHEETEWIDASRAWISKTKSQLHRVKHHVNYTDEKLAEAVMTSAETIMVVLLEAHEGGKKESQ